MRQGGELTENHLLQFARSNVCLVNVSSQKGNEVNTLKVFHSRGVTRSRFKLIDRRFLSLREGLRFSLAYFCGISIAMKKLT
jgi:hypothetical protein